MKYLVCTEYSCKDQRSTGKEHTIDLDFIGQLTHYRENWDRKCRITLKNGVSLIIEEYYSTVKNSLENNTRVNY